MMTLAFFMNRAQSVTFWTSIMTALFCSMISVFISTRKVASKKKCKEKERKS